MQALLTVHEERVGQALGIPMVGLPSPLPAQALLTVHKERAGLVLGIPIEGLPPPRIRLAMRASEEIFIRQLKGSFIGQGGRGVEGRGSFIGQGGEGRGQLHRSIGQAGRGGAGL